jgi:CRISPR/Cas system endoribonuclease Cas6 (RAMP superfamily)
MQIAARQLVESATSVGPNALIDKCFSAGRRVEKRIALEFASPTAYRQIHHNILVPNPVGIFPGYLAAWNANCQPRFEEDLIALVEAEVAISRYSLRTQVVDFGEYREAGWVAQCGFTVFSEEIALRRVVHLPITRFFAKIATRRTCEWVRLYRINQMLGRGEVCP